MVKKALWLIIAAAVLPLVTFFLLQSAFSAREQTQKIEDEALAQARVVVGASDALLARSIGALDTLSTINSLHDGEIAASYDRARQIAALEPYWSSVIVSREADGAELFDLRKPLGPPVPRTTKSRINSTGLAIGPVVREGQQCPCVAVSRRSPGKGGPYVVTALISTSPFVAVLPLAGPRYGVSALVDPDGIFIARSVNNRERVGRPASRFVRAAVAGPAATGFYRGVSLEGYENYTAFARSKLSGWSAHVALSSRSIDSPTRQALGSITIAALPSLAWAVVLVTFGLRYLVQTRRVAERMQHAQKLEALGQLTGGIAHDFNNLLTPIVGALDILSQRPDLDVRARRMAKGGLASANRAAKLTGQLLAFSRRQKLSLQPLDICAMLADIEPLLRQSAGRSRLELNIAPDSCWVTTDPTQLELALLNLVINARDASADDGMIEISVTAGRTHTRPAWALIVADHGAGMPPEIKARAFEPFFTTKDQGHGTGLGLAQVFAFAQQSHGDVHIDSEPGEGTQVTLLLPSCETPPRAEQTAVEPRALASGPLKLLVVDDDEDVRAAIVAVLQEDGHDVDSAASGEDGLKLIAGNHYALPLVDFAMPGMNGAELIAQARQQRADQRFVIVTGYLDSEAVEIAAPGTPVIAKPFDPDALRRRVRELAA
ncbi:MAG: response regulator [Sphingomonas sp.]|nr:response regulator [Sphingomonas sp.]